MARPHVNVSVADVAAMTAARSAHRHPMPPSVIADVAFDAPIPPLCGVVTPPYVGAAENEAKVEHARRRFAIERLDREALLAARAQLVKEIGAIDALIAGLAH